MTKYKVKFAFMLYGMFACIGTLVALFYVVTGREPDLFVSWLLVITNVASLAGFAGYLAIDWLTDQLYERFWPDFGGK